MIFRNESELEKDLSKNVSIQKFLEKIIFFVAISASPQKVLTNTLNTLEHFKVEDIKSWDDISENESFFNLMKDYLTDYKGKFVMNAAAVVDFWTIYIHIENLDAHYLVNKLGWDKGNAEYFVSKLNKNN